MSNMINAMRAYEQALNRIGSQVTPMPAPVNNQPASGFQNLVKDAITQTVDTSRQAEQMSINAMAGKADIQDVVLAVSNAEVALDTVIAVRDTAIKAYKDIMSMPM